MATKIPPEILQSIFKELENHHLSKCLLVCKHWCSNILPIFWNNPLEIVYWYYHYQVIQVYISCLSKESKRILREHGIVYEATDDDHTAMYYYAGYLKEIEFNELYEACSNWLFRISGHDSNLSNDTCTEKDENDDFATRLFNKYFNSARFCKFGMKKEVIHDRQQQTKIIFRELLKLFVKNHSTSYKLIIQSEIDTFDHLSIIPEIIPKGSHLNIMRIKTNRQHSVLEGLSSTFTSIGVLTIKCNDDDEGFASYLRNGLPTINFLKIHLTDKEMPKLSNAMDEILIRNGNNLFHLWLKQGGNCFNLNMFKQCENLKTLRIKDSHLPDSKNMKPSFWTKNTLIPFISSSPTISLNRLTEFSLCIDASVNLLHLATIIQNNHGLLEDLFLKWEIEQDSQNSFILFQSILDNCQRLRRFFITITMDTIKFIPKFLTQCPKLNSLGIDYLRKDVLDITNWLPKIGMAIHNRNNDGFSNRIALLGFYFKFVSDIEAFNEFLECCSFREDLLELYFYHVTDWMNEERINLLKQYAKSGKILCETRDEF